jgi:hypothetical protein
VKAITRRVLRNQLLVGLGTPRRIRTVLEALQLVDDWSGNSSEQRAALQACKVVLAGDGDPETARGVSDRAPAAPTRRSLEGMTRPVKQW